ncbi:MAG TPA: hypothetical protein VE135_06250 [Pyrinomonadaceae bacterium]|nr:hypothetical protein [Pyrinomonadaceae bacterium]
MSSVALKLPVSETRASGWIIGAADDITWFLCSALGGYATIFLFKAGVPLAPILLAFIFVVDGPHVWSTMTRTYFDKSERQKRRLQLFAVVPLLLVGPLLWMLGYAGLFFVLAYAWAYYHHAKQEYGFVMLYKAKNKDRDAFDMKLDRHFIMVSLILPYAWYLEATHDLTLRFAFMRPLVSIVFYAYGLLTLFFVGRQVQKSLRGEVINAPKLALLAMSIPLQWYAFGFAIHHPFGILAAAIPINTFHALQYQRLMWYHNRNHYAEPAVKARAGFAAIINRSLIFYIAAGLVTNFAFHAITGAGLRLQGIWVTVFWGVSFTHYFLDSKIWRARGNKELAAALRL